MQYDYSVDFRPIDNRDALRLITVSRLSLINTLIDSRASVAFSFSHDSRSWELGLQHLERRAGSCADKFSHFAVHAPIE